MSSSSSSSSIGGVVAVEEGNRGMYEHIRAILERCRLLLYLKTTPNLSGPAVFSPASSTLTSRAPRHPFDSAKWGRICRFLSVDDVVDKNCIVEPKEAAKEDLVVPLVALFPNCRVQQKVLSPPFHNQVGEPSWLQSLQKSEDGPSMLEDWVYHCCGGKGGGFCAYTDISLCIHFVQVRLNILKGDDLLILMHIKEMAMKQILSMTDYEARRFIDQRVEVAVSRLALQQPST